MGAIGHDGLAVPGKVVLAHEPPFAIGTLRVDPSTRQIVGVDRSETLEPRVMQALVALYRASGIVTRDELIERCWDGRIVGEDAINRVISRIRHVAEDIGGGSFAVETITKVGYRLVPAIATGPSPIVDRPSHSLPPPTMMSRRTAIAGACAAAGVAGGAWIVGGKPWVHRPSAEVSELLRRADIAWKSGLDDQARQAVYYLERAVQIDPQFGAAWGALAVAYTHFLEGYGEAEMASVPGRIRSAASKALELDADNGDAKLALASIRPSFRNWLALEAELRDLSDEYPSMWLARGRLAFVMYQVGRLEEGIKLHRQVLAIDPMITLPYAMIARAYSNLGRVQEADATFEEARRHWPAHPMIWFGRYNHLLFSGRPQAAMASVMDPDARPSGIPDALIRKRVKLAEAVASRRTSDVERIVDEQRQAALADINFAPAAAPVFALFGRFDLAFDSLERYLLDQGAFGSPAPVDRNARRYTDVLFTRPFADVRGDPRFRRLIEKSGLRDYWRRSGTTPDGPHA